jgi:tetratricopeptide (TPR) repeat protein
MGYPLTSFAFCIGLAGCATLAPDGRTLSVQHPSRESDASAAQDAGTRDVSQASVSHGDARERQLTDTEQRYLDLALAKPRDAEPWFQLGNYYAARNRLAGAEFAYRQALKRENSPKTLHNLGLVQIRLGINALGEAHEQIPEDDPARRQTRELIATLLKERW